MLSEQEKKELREMNSKMFAIQTSAYSNDCEECKRLKKRIEELEDCIKDLQKDCSNKTNVIADYTSKLATNNLRITELEKENAELKEKCNILDESLITSTKNNIERQEIIDELKKRNIDIQDAVTMQMHTNRANKEIEDMKLTEAKEIIENLIDDLKVIDGEQTRELKSVKEAEQFLKEIEE